jgi:hypothetical protein
MSARALTHPRGCGFRFDKRKKVIFHVPTKRWVRGVCDSNKAAFFPRYSFERATRHAEISHTFNTNNSMPLATGRTRGPAGVRGSSIGRGHLLDAQMGRTMGYFKRFRLPREYFYDAAARDAWTKTAVPDAVRRYCANICGHAKACWQTFQRIGLVPVAHQLAVGCMRLRRGTMLDLVCKDEAGLFVPVELKSGFNSYYYKWTGHYMRAPFGAQTDCVFNQHQLQLLVSAELYRRSYWRSEPERMGVPLLMRFRTDPDGNVASDVHPLREWATDALPQVVRRLVQGA